MPNDGLSGPSQAANEPEESAEKWARRGSVSLENFVSDYKELRCSTQCSEQRVLHFYWKLHHYEMTLVV